MKPNPELPEDKPKRLSKRATRELERLKQKNRDEEATKRSIAKYGDFGILT